MSRRRKSYFRKFDVVDRSHLRQECDLRNEFHFRRYFDVAALSQSDGSSSLSNARTSLCTLGCVTHSAVGRLIPPMPFRFLLFDLPLKNLGSYYTLLQYFRSKTEQLLTIADKWHSSINLSRRRSSSLRSRGNFTRVYIRNTIWYYRFMDSVPFRFNRLYF